MSIDFEKTHIEDGSGEAFDTYLNATAMQMDEEDNGDGMRFRNSSVYATVYNIERAIEDVNQSLATYGFIQAPLNLASNDVHDVVRTVNCFFVMLQQRQRDVDDREELSDRARRLQCDKDNLSNNLKQTKKALEDERRENAQLEVKMKSMEAEHKRIKENMQRQIEALKTQCSKLIGLESQYKHTIAKKEREIEGMKEKLQAQLYAKSSKASASIEFANNLSREGGARGVWRAGQERNNDKMYQAIVGAFEDQKKELLQENSELRDSLRAIDAELQELRALVSSKSHVLSSQQQQQLNSSVISIGTVVDSTPALNQGQLDLPFDLAKEEIEKNLKERIRILHDKISSIEDGTNTSASAADESNALLKEAEAVASSLIQLLRQVSNENSESVYAQQQLHKAIELINRLKTKLEECQRIIREQDQLLQFTMGQQQKFDASSPKSFIRTSMMFKSPGGPFPITADNNEEELALLEKKKQEIDKENERLQEKCMKLDLERMQLMRERQEFEQAKALFLRDTGSDDIIGGKATILSDKYSSSGSSSSNNNNLDDSVNTSIDNRIANSRAQAQAPITKAPAAAAAAAPPPPPTTNASSTTSTTTISNNYDDLMKKYEYLLSSPRANTATATTTTTRTTSYYPALSSASNNNNTSIISNDNLNDNGINTSISSTTSSNISFIRGTGTGSNITAHINRRPSTGTATASLDFINNSFGTNSNTTAYSNAFRMLRQSYEHSDDD